MTTTATPRLERQVPNVRPFPAHQLHLLPEAVARASESLAERQAQLGEAAAKLRAARTAVEEAPTEDRLAASAATEQGKAMPKPKLPAAEAALAAAEREEDALRDVTISAAHALVAEVREAHAELSATVITELEHGAEVAAKDFERLEAVLVKASELRTLQHALGDTPDHLMGRSPEFSPARMGRQAERDPLRGPVRDALDALREAVGS